MEFATKRKSQIAVTALIVAMTLGLAPAALAEGLNPSIDLQGPSLQFSASGVGLLDLEIAGTKSFPIVIRGPVHQAYLYWAGGGSVGEDDSLIIRNGASMMVVTESKTDTDAGPLPAFTYVGYRADVTGFIQGIFSGSATYTIEIEDADPANNFSSELVGVALVVVYDDPGDPNAYRVIMYDGVDWVFSRQGAPFAAPVLFSYAPVGAARSAEFLVISGDAERDRAEIVTVEHNPDIVNQLVGNVGESFDVFEKNISIPGGVGSTMVQLISPPEPPPADSLAWQVVGMRVPLEREECDLEVSKACRVRPPRPPQPPDTGNDCQGKVVSLKLEYTGEGCGPLANPQEGKASCSGSADGASPVSIRVTDKGGKKLYANAMGVPIGGIVMASAANAGESQFASDTKVAIGGLEEVSFHTSCSKPLSVGDVFGSLRIVEMTTTEGGTIGLPQEPDHSDGPEPTAECVIPASPPPPHCEGKLEELSLRYDGGDCTISNLQEGKATCSGNAGAADPVQIVVRAGSKTYLDTGYPPTVHIGDVVEALASNAGQGNFDSQTSIEIIGGGGTLQSLSIHTSCSKELNLGDRFGAVEVAGMQTTELGNIAQGAEVEYFYTVTNNGPFVSGVVVDDDQLGEVPGSPLDLAMDETVVLTATAFITEDTTNVVTVSVPGGDCEDTASATVTVEEPPEGPVVCDTKVQAMTLRYTGPAIGGPAVVEFVAKDFGVIYNLPGLAPGDELTMPAENDWTVDATAHGKDELGSKTSIVINGVVEVIHTSCSTPFVSGAPAPLDSPKGDPSPNWFVVSFRQK